jgi:CRISPR-associated protein (TIGR03986 family)
MAKGKIVTWIEARGFGFIQPEGTTSQEGQLFFHISDAGDIPVVQLTEGTDVQYSVGTGRDGRQAAKDVRLPGTPAPSASPKEKVMPAIKQASAYRFLNPYNFARFLGKPKLEANALLQGCPPPPHDRYVGISGKIVCRLSTLSPLFVSDSEKVGTCFDEHHIYRSFKVNGHYSIPGSSIRGMVRNIFEVATNSCLPVIHEDRLSRRLDADIGALLVPARVEKIDDAWKLRLLIGTSNLVIGDAPPDEQYAAWLHRYWPVEPSKTINPDPANPPKYPDSPQKIEFRERTAKGTEIDIGDFMHGQKCFARMASMPHAYHQQIKFWDVLEISDDEQALKKNRVNGQRVEEGYLCLNNKNTEKKHSERFFFRAKNYTNHAEFVELPPKVIDEFEKVIEEYQKEHEKEVKEWQRLKKPLGQPREDEINLSRFVYQKEDCKIKEGTLVYASLHQTPHGLSVEFIAPVLVPRVFFEQSILETLREHHDHLNSCKEFHTLCPACRVFGWVKHATAPADQENPARSEKDKDDLKAFAGRVRFSQATLTHAPKILPNLSTLAILSSPKPTTTRFYLMPANGSVPRQWKGSDAEAGYATSNCLRGRKIYRRHNPVWIDQKFSNGKYAYERFDGRADKQNRTIAETLAPQNVFEFEIDFTNLSAIELGALFWALEMEENMVHRLGYAKPLGFGSVEISVKTVKIFDFAARYKSIYEPGILEKTGSKLQNLKKDCIRSFKDAMIDAYPEHSSFNELDSIKDLQALLGQEPQLPVHYPRPPSSKGDIPEPDPEGKQFEWFVGNKRKHKLALPLAADDIEGFPLIKKNGFIA